MPKGIWIPLTKKQEQKIRDEYLAKPFKTLAKEIGVSGGRIKRFLIKEGLEVSQELRQQRLKASQYSKGAISFNKGKKQTDYMTQAQINKTKATRFKKGNIPANHKPVGSERSLLKGGYIEIKVLEPNIWKLKQRWIYEKQYKIQLTSNDVIIFKDGNILNFEISNLQKITKTENMYRNSIHKYPPEIIPSLVLINKINKQLKSANNEQQ